LHQQQQGPAIASTSTGIRHCINWVHQQQQGPAIASTAQTNYYINSNKCQT
jgi:hypothetical protein